MDRLSSIVVAQVGGHGYAAGPRLGDQVTQRARLSRRSRGALAHARGSRALPRMY